MKKIISSILALLTFVVASSTVSETLAAEPITFFETKTLLQITYSSNLFMILMLKIQS